MWPLEHFDGHGVVGDVLGHAAAEHVGLCSLPCPMMSSFSADVSVVRQGVTPSTDDYTAVGKVGITHELLMGCIVYAIDVQVTYGASKPIRKWFAGWNFMGQSAHRYFVVQPQTRERSSKLEASELNYDSTSVNCSPLFALGELADKGE